MKKIFIRMFFVICLITIGLFLGGYHFPLKNSTENTELIINMMDDSVKSVSILPNIVEIEVNDTIKDAQQIQIHKDSNIINGWVILEPKILGYRIKDLKF